MNLYERLRTTSMNDDEELTASCSHVLS